MGLRSQRIDLIFLYLVHGFRRQAVHRKRLFQLLFIYLNSHFLALKIAHLKIRCLKASCLNFLALQLIEYAPI